MTTWREVRPLSDSERQLLGWLITHAAVAERYRLQAEQVLVVSGCGCGCPSVDFGLDPDSKKPIGASEILADYYGVTPEGALVGVLLHARHEMLAELEVWSPRGEPISMPILSSLTESIREAETQGAPYGTVQRP